MHRELLMDLNNQPFYYKNKIMYKQKGRGKEGKYGEFEVDYVYLTKVATNQLSYSPVPSEIAQLKWVNK